MICFFCHRPIRGAELNDRYEWRNDGGVIKVFGKSGLPLKAAHGQLQKLSHGKCYHAFKKQEQLAAAKAADPSVQPVTETDWRDQTVVDVEELSPGDEGDRDN